MSGVTKGQLETQNAELLEAVKKLEKMNVEAMALARRARNDSDDIELAAVHFKQQRDRLIGYIEGTRRDRDDARGAGGMVMSPQVDQGRLRTRTDEFLDQNREEPEIVNAAERRRL